MTEKAKTTRTPRTRKTVAKPEVIKEDAVAEVVETKVVEEVKSEAKTIRKKVNQIELNELIPVRSLTNHKLVYVSKATNSKYVWGAYGDIEYLTYGEINTMKAQYPRFIQDCLIAIEDDEVIDILNLGKLYENLYTVDELDDLFDKSNFELQELLPKLPNGVKKSVISRAKELIENETLVDFRKIKTIETLLNVDLSILIK